MAEEKKKAYCCVVWTANAVDRATLQRIEQMARGGHGVDESGVPCLEVIIVFIYPNKVVRFENFIGS